MMEEKKYFEVSPNMKVRNKKTVKSKYVVLKFGGKTYSTSFCDNTRRDLDFTVVQESVTKNVGTEDNLWIKDRFTEKENHEKIEPIEFEINIYAEEDAHALRTSGWVYDSDLGQWVRLQQPAMADDISGIKYKTTRIEWVGENPLYIGKHETLNADVSDTNWWIRKYSYSSGKVSLILGQVTSWSDRASGWS